MNHSHVALDTGEDVEEHFNARDDGKHVAPHPQHLHVIPEGATTAGNGRRDANQLHPNHMVGEDVRGVHGVAAPLPPPALETEAEDEDGEGEEENGVGEGEGNKDGVARRGVEAAVEEGIVGGVGGRGVDGHVRVPEGEDGNTKRERKE